MQKVVIIIGVLMLVFLILDTVIRVCVGQERPTLTVTAGPHAGRSGKVVTAPWIGTIYNLRLTLNVAATEEEVQTEYGAAYGDRINELTDRIRDGHGPRHWITVWRSQCIVSGDG